MNAKRLEKFSAKFKANLDTGCIEWQGSCTSAGYGQTSLDGKHWYTHRLAYTLAFGDIPSGLMVRHMCENRKCGNPDHLRLGTNQENMQDRLDSGHKRAVTFGGENHHNSKLTEDRVVELRNRLRTGETAAQISQDFGVSVSAIGRAATGITWADVPGCLPPDFLATKGDRHGARRRRLANSC